MYYPASARPSGKFLLFNQASESAEAQQGGTQSIGEYISASDNVPVSAKLRAVDNAGHIPGWLSVNGQTLNGISYTTGSEISFDFDAANLSVGTYYSTVTAFATGYDSAVLNIKLSVTSNSTATLTNIKVNFQDSATKCPSGWLRDYGQSFGSRTSASQGSGNMYGWIKRSDNTPLNLTKNSRKRNTPSDTLLATLIHMQANNQSNFNGTAVEGKWQAQVANGNYEVTVSVGDGTATDSKHSVNVEGVSLISQFVPTASVRFKTATVIVSVSDNYLTADAIGGTNTKINWITIKPYTGRTPSVVSVSPGNSSGNVSVNTSISTSVLKLPNSGINNATITTSNVFLVEEATGATVLSSVNGTGGGDAITLVPASPLKPKTAYTFNITSGVKDLSGSSFIPYSSTFTTGLSSGSSLTTVQFDKISLPNTTGQHSTLTIGPDKKLYALTNDGVIKRFVINADGTLGTPQLLYSLQSQHGTRTQTLAVGLTFDPSSTATNLIAWVTHDTYVFFNAPDWDGKLTRLSGPNLETTQDILVNLPRSKKDHVTNSIAFGPDGALYFNQASTSAMGRGDQTWGYRNEHLLSAAVLRLDLSKLTTIPLDVKTSDGGGSYNPYNSNAPLTIYASGIRNAYDLVWHSNGHLYLPTNSSAAGGNTPASANNTLRPDGTTYNGSSVPALTNVVQTPSDYLFRIVKGGYYGHPNPLRGEFVMNGGNPTSAADPAEITDYPVGTAPDRNYHGYSFDFQLHASPNGAIEYKSNNFKGALKGKLLVVRYSQHKDIIALTPGGSNGDIVSAAEGYSIPGFSGFEDPLDLTEDTTNGNIYVSEYGGDGKITLLRPGTQVKPAANNVLLPSDDAFIRDGTYAGKNYGSDTSLIAKGTAKSGFARVTYLKFSLNSISNVGHATLRLYGNNIDGSTAVNITAMAANNDTWTENSITWSNAPSAITPALGFTTINSQKKYYEFDVTNLVKSELAGDKVVSFIIKDTNNLNNSIVFNSKENASFSPQLLVTADNVGSNVPSSSKTIVPLADAYTRNGSFAATNYGTDTSLVVKSTSATGYARATYLKFSLDSVTNVSTAKLRIFGRNTENATAVNIRAFGVTDDNWTEKGITWNNAPVAQSMSLSSAAVNDSKYYEFDVTSFIRNESLGNKIASFLIKDTANQNKTVVFNSRENPNYPPQLIITDSLGYTSSARSNKSNSTVRAIPMRPSCDGPSEMLMPADNKVLAMSSQNETERSKIYPNPVYKKFNIRFGNDYTGNVSLQIIDAVGKTFELGKRNLKAAGTNIDFDITNLSLKPGAYFLKISSFTKIELIKMIVQ